MIKFIDNDPDENRLCEICWANPPKFEQYGVTMDMYWINTHCIEIRRNREAREHKNINPKETSF